MSSYEDQLRVLNAKKIQARKLEKELEELAALPTAIAVTYIGPESNCYHKGRSKMHKRDPYCFNKGKPYIVSEPADVKYFSQKSKVKGSFFEVSIVSDEELLEEDDYDAEIDDYDAEIDDDFNQQIEEQKAKIALIETDKKVAKKAKIEAKKKARLKKAKQKAEAKKKVEAKKPKKKPVIKKTKKTGKTEGAK